MRAELRGVTKGYREGEREHHVLRELDLALAAGEILVVRGPSGSGKSTILNLVAGLDLPDRGDWWGGGRGVDYASDDERTLMRREHIGVVFQFFNLLEGLTVAENIRLPLELLGRAGAEHVAWIEQILDKLELHGREDSVPERLSGGERQRVAVARALSHRPALVLADEPTGNLDERTGESVLDLLCSLVREQGTSLIIVTHSDAAAARGDRVCRLKNGKLVPG